MSPQATTRTELALRRALLAADRGDAPVQDQLDAAELALELGGTDLAAMLYGAAAFTQGITAGIAATLSEANSRHNLWTRVPDAPPQSAGFCFDIAVSELRSLMQLAPSLRLPEPNWQDWLPPEQSMGPPVEPAIPPGVDVLAEQVALFVRAAPERLAAETMAELKQLFPMLMSLKPIRIDEQVDLPIETLAALFVLERVRHFVVAHADLLTMSTDALFKRAATLPVGALGPYFTNVSLLIRTVDDLFVLVDGAADGRADASAAQAWVTLLSIHLRHHQINELIDELGDRGMLQAAGAILLRLARPGPQSKWLDAVRRIRDVGLDVGDLELASRAQHLQALRSRTDSNDWKILADLHATAGQTEDAERCYQRALFLAPNNTDAQLHLAHLRSGTAVRVEAGLETALGRRSLRLARFRDYTSPKT